MRRAGDFRRSVHSAPTPLLMPGGMQRLAAAAPAANARLRRIRGTRRSARRSRAWLRRPPPATQPTHAPAPAAAGSVSSRVAIQSESRLPLSLRASHITTCPRLIGTGRRTSAASRRSIAASSAPMRLPPAVCAGIGSTAATRTIPAALRCSGSCVRGRRSSATTQRCRCGCRSAARKFPPRGAPMRWWRRNGSGEASAKSCSGRGTAASAHRSDSDCRMPLRGC